MMMNLIQSNSIGFIGYNFGIDHTNGDVCLNGTLPFLLRGDGEP